MSESPSQDWQDQLQASLRRAQDAIARGVAQQDQRVGAWTQGLRSAYPDWGRERWQRRLERKLRKRAEREARIASATLVEGYLWLLGAMVLLIAALSLAPFGLFLLFPAVNLGVRGSRVISRHMGITHPTAAAAGVHSAAGVTQASAQERQRREGDDEEHDGRQEPQVPLEEAGVGDLRLAFGAPAQLALQTPLPALAPPVGVGGAQALGPGRDHLLLLRGAARDGLLRAPQRGLQLRLPVLWVARVHEAVDS